MYPSRRPPAVPERGPGTPAPAVPDQRPARPHLRAVPSQGAPGELYERLAGAWTHAHPEHEQLADPATEGAAAAGAEATEQAPRGEQAPPGEQARPVPASWPAPVLAGRSGPAHARRRQPHRRPPRRAALLAGAALLLVVAALGALLRGESPWPSGQEAAPPASDSLQQAIAWLSENLDPAATVFADASTAAALRESGHLAGSGMSVTVGQPSFDAAPDPPPQVQLFMSPVSLATVNQSLPLARFGTGEQRLEIRQPLPPWIGAADLAADLEMRRMAGGQLVENLNLRLTPEAWAVIGHGNADSRLLTVLGALVARYRIDVAELPRDAAEENSPAPYRIAHITAIEGSPVSPGAPAVAEIQRLLAEQPDPYIPATVEVQTAAGRDVLVVGYRAPTPLGLVPQVPSSRTQEAR